MQPSNPLSSRLKPLTTEQRNELFGKFRYTPKPTLLLPEAIEVEKEWLQKNIIKVVMPDAWPKLLSVRHAWMHRLVVPYFLQLVAAWDKAAVLSDIISWGGCHNARLVRGTTQGTLSAHSWGSAFDINMQWNSLGATPTPMSLRGSVMRLVPIAEALGWYWGGRFQRKDGMHFELARISS